MFCGHFDFEAVNIFACRGWHSEKGFDDFYESVCGCQDLDDLKYFDV